MTEDPDRTTPPLDRRRALTTIGGLGLGLVAAACGTSGTSGTSASSSTGGTIGSSSGATTPATSGSAATAAASGTSSTASAPATLADACILMPEVTEGPYFIEGDQLRSDIREDRRGAAFALGIAVVDATSCAPIKDATVDIWHCDAVGTYAGFQQASRAANGAGPGGGPAGPGANGATDTSRFLRGIQVTDADGLAAFTTIYPGWYRGRTVHIHVKVRVGSRVHTGQIFFDDTFTDQVYTRDPYTAHGTRDTRNANDSIFQSSSKTIARVAADGSGYRGTITLAVTR